MNLNSDYNFGFDTVDANAYANPKLTGLDFTSVDGKRLTVSCDDLRHHSDLMAEFLRFKGVKPYGTVVVSGLEGMFELYLVLAAIIKLEAIVVIVDSSHLLEALNRYHASAVIIRSNADNVEMIDQNYSTPLLKVSVGMPIPKGWKDLHRGSWRVHEFIVPQVDVRKADDVHVIEYDGNGERRYTRSDLGMMQQKGGWKGFVSAQLQRETYVVKCDQ